MHVADRGGGAERSVLTLHQSLRELGHDCRLFVGSKILDEPGVIEIEQRRPIPGVLRITRRLEQKGIQNLYAPWFRNLPDMIGEADIVHLHSLWKARHGFADLTGICRIAKRYPTVMTLRESWMMTGHCACPTGCDRWKTGCGSCPDLQRVPSVQSDFTRFNWQRKRTTIQQSDLHITTISNWLRQQVQQSPICEGKKVHVVHNSVDERSFFPGDMLAARNALSIPHDKFVVLLAGQSIEGVHRGISQHAVKALNRLDDHGIHALLIGRSAGDVAATLNTPSSTVPYRESPQEMAQCYQAADLTIVPSEYETFGRVAAESLFCGTPVLAFATGGLTDIVVPNVCGKLVPTGDVDALAAGLADLKSNPDALLRMRNDCVSHVRERFGTKSIAVQYGNVYQEVIAARSMRPGDEGGPVSTANIPANKFTASTTSKISCVIPAYNCEAWLQRAVESILATRYASLEILIVEDGSTDETLQVANQLKARHPQTVCVLQHGGGMNRGVSASRNLGLRNASGEWICFLDADDYVYPNRFESATKTLIDQPDVDGVHQLAEMVFPDKETCEQWWECSPYFGFEHSIDSSALLGRLLEGKCWATSAILFRKSLLERTGLFDEGLQIAEDCHLWFRMAAVGKIVSGDLNAPVSAYWRRIDSAYQPSPLQRLQMIRSMVKFLNWVSTADVPAKDRDEAKKAIQQYILRGLTNARFAKQRTLAWSIAWQAVRQLPSISINSKFCGQVARLAIGR
ncbi:glycosyl transferase, group 1 family [Rhodopirellula maiorica SM1]|uniref:Glycosyl transferase, group 1 family n=1 Tax=Rhodopirellula maiorica SM1 TaxID=1265738 RepID=M5RVB0_9BACT|nr:glycosyltransferase [Rhodopirellula maiorica]EMI17889.1 glycosyl transferase, group 1 family [Rhodopirellula maiorica SM1]